METALRHRAQFIHETSGFINELALATAMGVHHTTVGRILRLERPLDETGLAPASSYHPSRQILLGLGHLRSLDRVLRRKDRQKLDADEILTLVWNEMGNAPEYSPAELEKLIRPRQNSRSRA